MGCTVLLKSGSDVYAKDNAGKTSLDYARQCDNVKAVEMLINQHAEPDNTSTTSSNTALQNTGMNLDTRVNLNLEMSLQAPLKTLPTEQLISSAEGKSRMERYIWVGQELSDRACASDRLQTLLSKMNTLSDWILSESDLSYIEDFHWFRVWENLWRIRNSKCIHTLMNILRILVADKSIAQYAWTSMMKISGDNIITLSVMEILCLCAEKGVMPTDGELQRLLERTDAMTRNEELAVAFLKTLIALYRNKHFTCDLQFLGNFYVVSQEMLQLGKQMVCAVHNTIGSCVNSGKLIDIMLFISNGHEETQMLIENSSCENWLKRSPLHLAAIIFDSKKAWKCLPKNILKNNLNDKDLHGCTPLHLAYLHDNKEAVQFLIDHGAESNVKDNFGMSPKSLGRTTHHFEDKYKELCCHVLEAKSAILKEMRPLLVHSEIEAKALSKEVKTLFERLVQETRFLKAEILIAGSMREKLKAGRLDEVDLILKFTGEIFDKNVLFECLRKRLAQISWDGISLRPISVHGPWKFLRRDITVSLDVAVIFVDVVENRDGHRLQGQLVRNSPLHKKMVYFTLETWNCKGNLCFKTTNFAYEWDIIDNLSASCRLAIVIAKALVQAYDLCRNDWLRVKLPVTSYMIKTALFYILAYQSGHLDVNDLDLNNALANVEKNMYRRPSKLVCDSKPKWITDADVGLYSKDAQDLGRKIFTLIKCVAQQKKKLKSYWDREVPVVGIGDYGEAECIGDVCDCALERLNSYTFYSDNGP